MCLSVVVEGQGLLGGDWEVGSWEPGVKIEPRCECKFVKTGLEFQEW